MTDVSHAVMGGHRPDITQAEQSEHLLYEGAEEAQGRPEAA